MTVTIPVVVLLASLFGLQPTAVVHVPVAPQSVSDADRKIWPEFVSLLEAGRLDERHVRAAHVPNATMLEFLAKMREGASWVEWERQPEAYRVGDLVHFVAQLSERGVPNTYSFTFHTENGRWALQHFEGIIIRLDRVGELPVSSFPDIDEGKKRWMRSEDHWSKMVVLFRRMRALAGAQAAFDMFRDGLGYFVAAKTWVPLVAPSRAFVLYACWEQSRLQGDAVTLQRLGDNEAVVAMEPIYFALYRQTGHLRQHIDEQDYRKIFETIWQDRAAAAGWKVEFRYDGSKVTLRFTK